MGNDTKKVPIDLYINLIGKFAEDFLKFTNDTTGLPNEFSYKVAYKEEPASVMRSARKAALQKLAAVNQPLAKFAFDTRRIDQENDRIPRSNLQYWHRSDEFITEAQSKKIETFKKLFSVLDGLKESYGASPDWHDSYARILHDSVDRALRISQGDSDITESQLSYLEQLLDARYRLRMADLEEMNKENIKTALLKKDESLVRRGEFPIRMNKIDKHSQVQDLFARQAQGQQASQPIITSAPVIPEIHNHIVVDGGRNDEGINALLNGNGIVRKEGERIIERTITIKIRDEVID